MPPDSRPPAVPRSAARTGASMALGVAPLARRLTFDVRGGLRLAARRPLDGGVRSQALEGAGLVGPSDVRLSEECRHTSPVAFDLFVFSPANRSFHSRSNSKHRTTAIGTSDLEDHSVDRTDDHNQGRNHRAGPPGGELLTNGAAEPRHRDRCAL